MDALTFVIVRRIAPYGWDGMIASRVIVNDKQQPVVFFNREAAYEQAVQMQLDYILSREHRVKHEVLTVEAAKTDLGTAWPQD